MFAIEYETSQTLQFVVATTVLVLSLELISFSLSLSQCHVCRILFSHGLSPDLSGIAPELKLQCFSANIIARGCIMIGYSTYSIISRVIELLCNALVVVDVGNLRTRKKRADFSLLLLLAVRFYCRK